MKITMRYFFIFILIFFQASVVQAATMYFADTGKINIGEQISLDIIINTDGKAINSVEASIGYLAELLTFVGYQDGAGVVKLWVTPPQIKEEGVVHFAGGMPGGIDGTYSATGKSSEITLVRLLFKAKKSGAGVFSIIDSTLLLNDGKATPLLHDRRQGSINVGESVTTQNIGEVDMFPPIPFSITIIQSDSAGRTPRMISFSAYDAESGISKYKVKSGMVGRWREVISPYVLPNKFFSYTVKVAAFDAYGNKQVATTRVKGILPGWFGIALLVLIGTGVWRIFMIKKKV